MPVDKTRFTARQSSPSSRLSLPLAAVRAPRRMRILRLVPSSSQSHVPNVHPRPRASSSSPIVIPHRHRIASHRRARTNIRRRVHRPARGFTTAKVKKRPRRRRRPASRSSSTARRYRRSRRHSRARRERRRRHRHRCHHHHRHRPSVFVTVAARSSVSRLPSPVVVVPRLFHSSPDPWSRSLLPSTDRSTDRPFDRPPARPTSPGVSVFFSSVRPSDRPIVRSFVRSTRRVSTRDSRNRTPHKTHTPRRRGFQKKRKKKPSASSCTSCVVVYLFVVV